MYMDTKNVDFYELCLDEGHPFYSEIYSLDKVLFNEWIRENLKEIIKIEKYEEVVPNNILLDDLMYLGYQHINYQCHYSAKAITILNENLKYFTGFVERNSYPHPIITHSFNIMDEKVIDFARINNPEYPYIEEDCGLPHIYYGMEIPREFVLYYQNETMQENSMKPLLYEWYLENNK